MNREIKFRAWQKAHKKMFYKVNLYSMSHDYMTKAQLDNRTFMDSIGLSCEIMQSSDYRDDNDVEVYEGDVVQVEYGKGIVVFHASSFMIHWIDDPEANMELLTRTSKTKIRDSLKVLGNIYEHPHLLNPLPNGK